MSEELDRRVAIEVMGEEEPLVTWPRGYLPAYNQLSENWSWLLPQEKWVPVPFSTSLEHAERALKKKLRDIPGGIARFALDEQGWVAWTNRGNRGVQGSTLPITICNLLLALKERDKG